MGRPHVGPDALFEESTGKFLSLTSDCGSDKVKCSGSDVASPATLVEFKLDGYDSQDFFDVCLIDDQVECFGFGVRRYRPHFQEQAAGRDDIWVPNRRDWLRQRSVIPSGNPGKLTVKC
ncbi:unnamed protein product [Linum trigynum]|uniref:Uncharacterized protein n=1 Tax=Linum trigynum TaxID=586398 RepID=A0AAV2DFV5_9ROSI